MGSGRRFGQSCKDSRGKKTIGSYTALVDAGEYRILYSNAIKAERETVEL